MKIQKIRNVKTPNRGTTKSAGIDFFIPKFDKDFIEILLDKNPKLFINLNEKTFELSSGERVLIPSGIKVDIPNNYVLIAFNKSGISSKYGLDVLACVIDEDYTGEIHINLVNTSNYTITICEEQKIIQFLLMPIFYCNIELVDDINKLTNRGEAGFGSTGN